MRRGLKIGCWVFAVLLLLIAVTIVVIYFTLLKPKQPELTPQPVILEYINANLPAQMNVTLGITINVYNPNYGSFRYTNSTTYITYRGTLVAEAPIQEDYIPARRRHNITTSVVIFADKLVQVPGFLSDMLRGVVNTTSSTTLHGQAKVFKIFKKKATTNSTCDISIFWIKQRSESVCKAEVKY